MVVTNEKLLNFFEESEVQKIKEESPKKYKILSEKIHILTETQEKIAKLKVDLNWNLDQRVERLLWLIEEREKPKTLKWKIWKVVSEESEGVKLNLRKQAEKRIPFFWGKIFDWAFWLVEKSSTKKSWISFWKIFWTLILWFIWIKNIPDFLGEKKLEEWANELLNKITWDNNSDVSKSTESVSTEKEIINSKVDYYYKWGFKLLVWLSWIKLEDNIWTWKISDSLKDVNYQDLLDGDKKIDIINWIVDKESEDYGKIKTQYEKVYDSMASKNVQDLLRIWLTWNMVQAILMWQDNNAENNKLKSAFWEERFLEILTLAKSWNFDYKKLSVGELSVLHIKTLPILSNWLLLSVSDGISSTIWWFLWYTVDEIKELVKNSENDLFSKELIETIVSKGDWMQYNDPEYNEDKLNIEFWINDPKDKENFWKLFVFKKYIFWEDFLGNKKLFLWEWDKSLLKEKLNYRWILALYGIMWWSRLEDMNIINLPSVSLLLSKIMSSWKSPNDSLTSSAYIARFSKNILLENISTKNVFSDDEMRVLSIYKQKTLDILIINHLKDLSSKAWFISWNGWLKKTAAGIFIGWAAINYVWNKWITNAMWKQRYPFLSKRLKSLWVIGMSLWIILWWISALSNNKNFEKFDEDLEEAYENWDANKVIDILEKQTEGIKSYEYKDEKVVLVTYEWSDPYVLFMGKKYSIETISNRNSLTEAWPIQYWKNILNPLVKRKNTEDWKDLSPIIVKWNKLIFWETNLTLDFSKSISDKWWSVITEKNIVAKINWVTNRFDKDMDLWLWEGKIKNYIKIWTLSDDIIVCLEPVEN